MDIEKLKREYDKNFMPSQEYLDSLPDLQNSEFVGIPIEWVGIEGIEIPLRIKEKNGGSQEVLARVCGTVNIDADKKGINMSRIIRTLYKSKDDVFDINEIEKVLRNYQKDLNSFDAHILIKFKYRTWMPSLRSKDDKGNSNGAWKYTQVIFDANLDRTGEFKKVMYLDYIYSSACCCSTALSVHAAQTRGVFAIPHSQRSIARVAIESKSVIWIEDLISMLDSALITPVQVFVKREDEQAFAELNGSNPKFVEDAIRNIANEFNKHEEILDYKVVCCHAESLHPFNAVAVITKGKKNSIFNHHVSYGEWSSLYL